MSDDTMRRILEASPVEECAPGPVNRLLYEQVHTIATSLLKERDAARAERDKAAAAENTAYRHLQTIQREAALLMQERDTARAEVERLEELAASRREKLAEAIAAIASRDALLWECKDLLEQACFTSLDGDNKAGVLLERIEAALSGAPPAAGDDQETAPGGPGG